jgi:invasion protein IalB
VKEQVTSVLLVLASALSGWHARADASEVSAPQFWGDAPSWYQAQVVPTATAPAPPAPAPWDATCTGTDRTHPLNCEIEQRVVISKTGQLLIDMTVKLPDGAAAPVMLIHTPYGLYLPAGLTLAVDGAAFTALAIQTCDNNGCYAGSPIEDKLLSAMLQGTSLTVTFQNLQKKNIPIQ